MSDLTRERKEYLKEYKQHKLKRVPLEMSYDAYLALLQHIGLFGKKKTVNGYIKEALAFVMEIEEAGLADEVRKMIDRRKRLASIGESKDESQ